jgi:hypothetical protein
MVDELEMEETPIPEQEPPANELSTRSADEEETPIEQQDPDEEEA